MSLRQYLFEQRDIGQLVHAFSDLLHTLKILHAIDQIYGTLNCMNILVNMTQVGKVRLILRPFFVDLPILKENGSSNNSTPSLKEQRYKAFLQKKRSLSYTELKSVEDPYSFSLNEENKLSIMQFQENWIWYEAPENVFLMNKVNLTREIDVWALGCILVEMHIKHPLFSATSVEDQIINTIHIMGYPQKEHIRGLNQLGFFDYVSNNDHDKMGTKSVSALKATIAHLIQTGPLANVQHIHQVSDLAAHLLNFDITQRFTINQIIQHPLFQIDEEDIIRIIHRSASKTPLYRRASVESTASTVSTAIPSLAATPMSVETSTAPPQNVLTVKKPSPQTVERPTPVVNPSKRKQSPVPTVTFKRSVKSPTKANISSASTPKFMSMLDKTKEMTSSAPSKQHRKQSPSPRSPTPPAESPVSSAQSTPIRKTHASKRSSSPSLNTSVEVRQDSVKLKHPKIQDRTSQQVNETISSIGSLSIRRQYSIKKPPSITVHVAEPTSKNLASKRSSSAAKRRMEKRKFQESATSPMIHSSPSISTPGAFPFHTPYHATPQNERSTSPNQCSLSWMTDEESIVPDSGMKSSAVPPPTQSLIGSESKAQEEAKKTKFSPSPPHRHSDSRSDALRPSAPVPPVDSPTKEDELGEETSPREHQALTISSASFQEGPVSTLSQSDTSSVEESLMLVSLLNDCKFDLKELTKRLLNQSNVISPPKAHQTPRSSHKQKHVKPTLQLVNGRSPHRTLKKHKRHAEVKRKRPKHDDNPSLFTEETLTVYSSDSTLVSYSDSSDGTSAPQDKYQLRRSLKRVKKQLRYLRKSNQKHARLLKKVSHVISPSASFDTDRVAPFPSPKVEKTPRLAMLHKKSRQQREKSEHRDVSQQRPVQNPDKSSSHSAPRQHASDNMFQLNATPDITNYYEDSLHYREIDQSSTHTDLTQTPEDTAQQRGRLRETLPSHSRAKYLSILIDAMKGIPSKARYYLFRWERNNQRVEIPVKRQFHERTINGVSKFVEQKFYIKIRSIPAKDHDLWKEPLHVDLYGNAQDIASRSNRMATCAVDLYLLSLCMDQEFYEINGWYHVMASRDGSVMGQMQVRCSLCSDSHSSRHKSSLTAYEGVLSVHSKRGSHSSTDMSYSEPHNDQKVSNILRETQASFEDSRPARSDRSMNFEDVWKTLSGFDENLLGKHLFTSTSSGTIANRNTSFTGYESSGETKQLESTLNDLKKMGSSLARG